jgi:4-hydroxy-tetrahydrodipicolinate synthase
MTQAELGPRLKGVIPPIITPMTVNRRFDAASGRKLCEFMLESGVHGLFVLGTSGEGPYLSEADQLAAVRTAVEVANRKVPVLAGLLAPGTDQACQLAQQMQDLGADAVVVAPPYYYPATQAQIMEHFRAIRQAIQIPVMAYDIPITTHHRMQLETVLTLANEGTVIGMKDSTGDYGTFRRLQLKAPANFRLLTGSEPFFDSVLNAGAHGVVPGLSNVAPQGFVALYNAYLAGNQTEMVSIQSRLTRLLDVFFKLDGSVEVGRAIAVMKTALHLRNVIATTVTSRPFPELSSAEVARVRGIMQETGFLA